MEFEHFTQYRTSNLTGFRPAVRLQIQGSRVDPADRPSLEQTRRAEGLLRSVLGQRADYANWPDLSDVSCFAQMFLELVWLLQTIHRHPVTRYGAFRVTGPMCAEVFFDVYRTRGAEALCRAVLSLINEVAADQASDSVAFADQIRSLSYPLSFNLINYFLHDRSVMAAALGIPARRDAASRAYFGEGRFSRLASSGYSPHTPRLGHAIAGDKSRSYRLFASAGLPVPEQRTAKDLEKAVEAAAAIGYPVVVKPLGGSKGRGVFVDLRSEEDIRQVFALSPLLPRVTVVVEHHVPGDDYRILVVGERVAGVVKRLPAQVVGDGKHSIRELMRQRNAQERRDGYQLYPLREDEESISLAARQGLRMDEVPQDGQVVLLRQAANVSQGGTAVDVTDMAHPDNLSMAVDAAKLSLLDVAGVDFVTTDIARSWRDGLGKIVEINAGPGVDLHMQPAEGRSQPVSYRVLRHLYTPRNSGQIPGFMVVGGRSMRAAVGGCLARSLAYGGHAVGASLNERKFARGRALEGLAETSPEQLLQDHRIDSLVLAMSRKDLLRRGFPVNQARVTLICDAYTENLYGGDRYNVDTMARQDRMLAMLARDAVVVKADDQALQSLLADVPARHLVLVFTDIDASSRLWRHVLAGGRALALVRRNQVEWLCWFTEEACYPLSALENAQTGSASGARLERASRMLAMAALCAWDRQLMFGIPPALRGLATSAEPISTLSLQCRDGALLVSADPRDQQAASEFKRMLASLAPGRMLHVYLADDALPEAWREAIPADTAGRTRWVCSPGAAARIRSGGPFSLSECVETAWRRLGAAPLSGDLYLLLMMNDSARQRLDESVGARTEAAPVQPRDPAGCLWTAEELARAFAGSWVSGPERCWGVQRVVADPQQAGSGALVVLPSLPDSRMTAPKDERIAASMRQGASAVVSRITDPDLPRWFPVLVCDSSASGLAALSVAARDRFRGRLSAVVGESRALVDPFSLRLREAVGADGVNSMGGSDENHASASEGLQLALANLSPDVPHSLYALHGHYDLLGWLRPHVCVAFNVGPVGLDRLCHLARSTGFYLLVAELGVGPGDASRVRWIDGRSAAIPGSWEQSMDRFGYWSAQGQSRDEVFDWMIAHVRQRLERSAANYRRQRAMA